MNTAPPNRAPELSEEQELALLLDVSARILMKAADPVSFLEWIADAGPTLAPGHARLIDPRTGPVGHAFRAMGVAIYNVMPQPAANFQARRLAEPGRNEDCLCGSGNKYKHCCLALKGVLDLAGYNMLRHVLDNWPKKGFSKLPGSHVDLMAVYDTARQWRAEDDAERAVALLEPWFAGDQALGAKVEPLFDLLMDCYLELGRERKRLRLIAEVLRRGERPLRAAALHRQAAMAADLGDLEAAWESFRQAQRDDPDNPHHASLEITLLVSRGEFAQARDRARFWAIRLERMRDPELADMIGWLRSVQADPERAMKEMDRMRLPGLDRLEQLLAAAPAPAACYETINHEDAGLELVARPDIEKLELRWRRVFPQIKPPSIATQHGIKAMWDQPDAWLDFLERNPPAWQSFDIVDDLAMAVDALPTLGTDTKTLPSLLERGVAMIDANLEIAEPGEVTLQWGWLENRPALRLFAHRIYLAQDVDDGEETPEYFVELAQRMIALNPGDNHFLRDPLTRAYLARGEAQKVIALTDRFPDDFCSPTLNRLLALVRLDRRGEALGLLHEVGGKHHTAIDMLLAANPKAPRPDGGFGITVGGKQEAWMYRRANRALWQQDGALDWLRKAWATVKKTLRP